MRPRRTAAPTGSRRAGAASLPALAALSTRVWTIRDGTTFECAACGHQTSLTSGTLLEKTRKPLKMWFRAVFEISTRRTGISAKDLQRIMGFGSYKTAWSWLHKLRAAMVRPDREPLGPFVQTDETLVGGKGRPTRSWFWWRDRRRSGIQLAKNS